MSILEDHEAKAVAEAVLRYHAGDDTTADELEQEMDRAIMWADRVATARVALDLIVEGRLSITIELDEREPRLFPHGVAAEVSSAEVSQFIDEVERLLEQGDDEF